MPIFKGFEKDGDTTLAVVDFPDARKTTPYFQTDGTIKNHVTPFPHEERLSEEAFQAKFSGLDFSAIKALPFKESGHDMGPLLEERRRAIQAESPAIPFRTIPGTKVTI